MARDKLYSKEDVARLLKTPENWVKIVQAALPKNTVVWDGKSNVIYKIIDSQSAVPGIGSAYMMRDLHSGSSITISSKEVHDTYLRFRISEEHKALVKPPRGSKYIVSANYSGQIVDVDAKPMSDFKAAVEKASAIRASSGMVTFVRDAVTGETLHTLDGPIQESAPAPAPASTMSPDEIASALRGRKSERLTADLLIPGIIAVRAGEHFYYEGTVSNDPDRHIFANLRTGERLQPVPSAIATMSFTALVPRPEDIRTLIPSYPAKAYQILVKRHGNLYTSPPPDQPPEKVVHVSTESARSVGRAAAERREGKPETQPPFAIQYKMINWASPRYYEKRYKSEYQATRRADALFGEPGMSWVSVINTATGRRLLTHPPGFDPDEKHATAPVPATEYVIMLLSPARRWSEFDRRYKTLGSAENRARTILSTGKPEPTVRVEIVEMPSQRLVYVGNVAGLDLKLFGVISPEKLDMVEEIANDPLVQTLSGVPTTTARTPVPPPPVAPSPATVPAPTIPEGMTYDESKRFIKENVFDKVRPIDPKEVIRARNIGSVREELSLVLVRKLVALACVSTISRYNVSVSEATVICQESSDALEELALAVSRGEMSIYTAIQRVDMDLVQQYDLKDITTAPAIVFGEGGDVSPDLEPAIRRIAETVLTERALARTDLASGKSRRFTKSEFEEAAFDLAAGKLKRSRTKHDLMLIFLSSGTATEEAVYNDFDIIIAPDAKGRRLVAVFDVTIISSGYIIKQAGTKPKPGRGFMQIVSAMRQKYGADIVVDEDSNRVDIELLM